MPRKTIAPSTFASARASTSRVPSATSSSYLRSSSTWLSSFCCSSVGRGMKPLRVWGYRLSSAGYLHVKYKPSWPQCKTEFRTEYDSKLCMQFDKFRGKNLLSAEGAGGGGFRPRGL